MFERSLFPFSFPPLLSVVELGSHGIRSDQQPLPFPRKRACITSVGRGCKAESGRGEIVQQYASQQSAYPESQGASRFGCSRSLGIWRKEKVVIVWQRIDSVYTSKRIRELQETSLQKERIRAQRTSRNQEREYSNRACVSHTDIQSSCSTTPV